MSAVSRDHRRMRWLLCHSRRMAARRFVQIVSSVYSLPFDMLAGKTVGSIGTAWQWSDEDLAAFRRSARKA